LSKRFKNWQYPEIREGKDTKWGWRVSHVDGLKLGKDTDIGYGCYIQAEKGVEIGDRVQVGAHTAIYSVSTIQGRREGKVIIEQDAEIGAHCLILPGVTIGKGAFVRVFTTVKHDVPAGKTVGPFRVW